MYRPCGGGQRGPDHGPLPGQKREPPCRAALRLSAGTADLPPAAGGGRHGPLRAVRRPLFSPERGHPHCAGAGPSGGGADGGRGALLGHGGAGHHLQCAVRRGGRGHLLRRQADHRHPRSPHLHGLPGAGGGGRPGGHPLPAQAPHRHRHSPGRGAQCAAGAAGPGVRRAPRAPAGGPGRAGRRPAGRCGGRSRRPVRPALRRAGALPRTLRPRHFPDAAGRRSAHGPQALRHRGTH